MVDPLEPAACLIDGERVVADGPGQAIIDPFTEKPMGSTPEAGAVMVDRAVTGAERAAREWSQVPVEDRAALLERIADLLDRDGERFAQLVSREMGMPISLARVTQAQLPATVLRATATAARHFPWQEEADGATLLRSGAGVVGAITPWNMPMHQIVAKVAAAIAAGCAVVLKPSEQTPYDAVDFAKLLLEAGAPAGLLNVVTGTGPHTGAALAGHDRLARMSFTGSVRAGREVAQLAGAALTRCALELGGKSPAVILPSADPAAAVPHAIVSGLTNSGQACNAPTRLLVPHESLSAVEELAASTVADLVMGDPRDERTQQGPLVTRAQRDKVLDHIRRATSDGGRLITGGTQPSQASPTGWYVDPTVIADLPPSAAAVQEEIFGPVIVVQTYRSIGDAVTLANDTAYGLSAEVWAGDEQEARSLAAALRAGQVKINGVRTRNRPMVPFGGMGHSGYGRELGPLGIEEFTEVTAVMS